MCVDITELVCKQRGQERLAAAIAAWESGSSH